MVVYYSATFAVVATIRKKRDLGLGISITLGLGISLKFEIPHPTLPNLDGYKLGFPYHTTAGAELDQRTLVSSA